MFCLFIVATDVFQPRAWKLRKCSPSTRWSSGDISSTQGKSNLPQFKIVLDIDQFFREIKHNSVVNYHYEQFKEGKTTLEVLDSIVDQMEDVAVEGLSVIWRSPLQSIMQQTNCFDVSNVRGDTHAVSHQRNFVITETCLKKFRLEPFCCLAQKSPKIFQHFLKNILNQDHIRKMLLDNFRNVAFNGFWERRIMVPSIILFWYGQSSFIVVNVIFPERWSTAPLRTTISSRYRLAINCLVLRLSVDDHRKPTYEIACPFKLMAITIEFVLHTLIEILIF